jgi:hypothetical protein
MGSGRVLFVLATAAALPWASVSAARADAAGRASCLGLESSSIAPAGTSEEFPEGRAELQAVVRQLARDAGAPPGAIVQVVAHLHAGSHAGCDEE